MALERYGQPSQLVDGTGVAISEQPSIAVQQLRPRGIGGGIWHRLDKALIFR